MPQLIHLLILVVIFAIVACGLYYVCVKFQLPQPVMWICGAILLILILVFVSQQLTGGAGTSGSLFH
jgi:hypothetical protein